MGRAEYVPRYWGNNRRGGLMVVRIGTSEAGGTFNLQGEALGKLLSGVMDAEILAFEGSSVANANRLHQGRPCNAG